MGKIVKLDEQLSNKIAAGEVVERPASIVKELVENAIDANSTQIVIEVEEGGLSKIKILDNGDGIQADDVETAFYRHATSKIKTDKDLFHIMTLGFRGEALPSIASVSFLELNTSIGDGAGTSIQLEGGKIIRKQVSNSRKGTEVIITNLFYNTPARLKYLKTVHTELGNISDIVNRIALAHPDISFQLFHNGKKMLHTNGNGNQLQVLHSIYGAAVAKQMISIEVETIDFRVTGYIVKPEVTRASRQYMSAFVNGRYIKNYALARAIQEGYHTLLPIGRYPIVVLNIVMDPLLIDVNVHPAKLEVRLSKEEELTTLVKDGIQNAFKKTQLIPEIVREKKEKPKSEQIAFQLQHDAQPSKWMDYQPNQPSNNLINNQQNPIEISEEEIPPMEEVEHKPADEKTWKVDNVREVNMIEETVAEKTTFDRVPTLYPIGQMHGTYILAQNEQGLYIIDQHAAQERIKYEYFKEKVGRVSTELQDLLVPITIECTQNEFIILKEYAEELKQVGLFLDPFGPQTYMIRSYPTWLPKGMEDETLREMIDEVLSKKKIDIKKFREEAAILMSCKAAIKANRHLRTDEQFALLETLRKCVDPFTCPHGRPIIIHYSTYEMEKMFKRIM
ncbi:DNA mismatch repair endonuclease MutL [Alkalihalobacterium alkalinitrilicum]|uniref:DNA mismatch repair endonuclease MutL n=1 Tax=Alkalihalobacterium alkalinitrilicum TaxID=427920 RepID=UPI000995180E|nr:DNA mismatch repair endonuclease MutL [Alkalihalobacterium alkalinitrilicum]